MSTGDGWSLHDGLSHFPNIAPLDRAGEAALGRLERENRLGAPGHFERKHINKAMILEQPKRLQTVEPPAGLADGLGELVAFASDMIAIAGDGMMLGSGDNAAGPDTKVDLPVVLIHKLLVAAHIANAHHEERGCADADTLQLLDRELRMRRKRKKQGEQETDLEFHGPFRHGQNVRPSTVQHLFLPPAG